MIVADEKLWHGERDASDQQRAPRLTNAAQPGVRRDEPERHHQREQGQLTAHHLAELQQVETGHRLKRHDGRAERTEGHGCRVGDERQSRRLQRRKAEPDEQGACNGNWRPETGRALEESAEAERNQHELESRI